LWTSSGEDFKKVTAPPYLPFLLGTSRRDRALREAGGTRGAGGMDDSSEGASLRFASSGSDGCRNDDYRRPVAASQALAKRTVSRRMPLALARHMITRGHGGTRTHSRTTCSAPAAMPLTPGPGTPGVWANMIFESEASRRGTARLFGRCRHASPPGGKPWEPPAPTCRLQPRLSAIGWGLVDAEGSLRWVMHACITTLHYLEFRYIMLRYLTFRSVKLQYNTTSGGKGMPNLPTRSIPAEVR